MEQTPETQAPTGTSGAATAASRELVQLTSARAGVLGIKAGMTQVFTEDGDSVAVTVIDLKPTVITQVKTNETNGYKGIQVGILEKKAKSVNKPDAGHAKKSGSTGFYHHQEFRLVDSDKMDDLLVGKVLSAEFVKPGDLVDLTAVSKGKGFQGGMKRFHMAGGHKTHGASICHRSLGSIGQRADPGRVWKNRKMPGQMGNVQRTVQNVRVIKVDVANQLLLVHGSVPGPRSGIVTVQRAIKAVSKASKR